MHNKVMGRTQTGFIEVYTQSLSAECDFDLLPSDMVLVHNTWTYKKIGYNINVMRQTACLVINPIQVNSFAYLFNCTTVGRTSD